MFIFDYNHHSKYDNYSVENNSLCFKSAKASFSKRASCSPFEPRWIELHHPLVPERRWEDCDHSFAMLPRQPLWRKRHFPWTSAENLPFDPRTHRFRRDIIKDLFIYLFPAYSPKSPSLYFLHIHGIRNYPPKSDIRSVWIFTKIKKDSTLESVNGE